MKALIAIPAHNEEENLPKLLAELSEYRDRYDVVVIDDASEDRTAYVARENGVPVVQLKANLGIGGAMQAGFRYAVDYDYDLVIQIDADGQHDPAWLNAMIAPIINEQANCVIGSRYMRGEEDRSYKTPFPRRVGMLFSSLMLYLATRKMIYDTTSGFRALDRDAFSYFAHIYPVDHPEAEALLMLHQAGFKILEVPIKMRIRQAGSSLFTWIKAARYPLRVVIGFMGQLLNPRR
jgi:glycosyltransferase involved in cell wall biosynthesis